MARLLLGMAFLSMGCTGSISGSTGDPNSLDPDDPGPGGGSDGTGVSQDDELPIDMPRGDVTPGPVALGEGRLSVTPRRIRRLTPLEYGRTVEAILGGATAYATQFPSDPTVHGFHNFSDTLEMRPLLTENLWVAAKSWIAGVPLTTLLKCTNRNDELGCARQTFRDVVRIAYHRDATDGDVAELMAVLEVGRTGSTFEAGVRLAYEVLLQSPYTMFRTELGDQPNALGYVTLTQQEIANQIAFMLTAGPPDDGLRMAAARDELGSSATRAEHVRRLLDGPRAQAALNEFARGWLMLETLRFDQKSTTVFPQFTATLKDQMKAESLDFVTRILADKDASVAELFTSRTATVDSTLAQFYGVEPQPRSFPATVELPPERGGILGRASLLSTLGHSAYGSPVMRGAFVRRRLLCESIPDPPPDINATVPTMAPRTTRELFAEHSRNPTCAGCHAVMDELGFPFEVFDGIGRYRTLENGHPIDARGVLEVGNLRQEVTGPIELTMALAQTPEANACFAMNWLRHASAREETDDEKIWSEATGERLRTGELNVRDMLLSTITSQTSILRGAR
ncbi:MAG: DUF1592 domain-containing protein [Deltaproteobacteria bacterium]|nr:DUF1592 domain-containing protein [Deltaproteobacteria bacterium]